MPKISVEKEAQEKIEYMMKSEKRTDSGLRIQITGRTSGGFQHALSFIESDKKKPDDTVVEADGIKFYLDPRTLENIDGTNIKFVDDIYGGGFKVENPNQPTWDNPQAQKVQEIIDERINPGLAMHGGYVELQAVKENDVYLIFGGGCQGCGMADVTMKQGIESMLREEFPELGQILDATDHASGANPYYQPSK